MDDNKFSRKVDGSGFRDYIVEMCGKEADKVLLLDGYDNAINH